MLSYQCQATCFIIMKFFILEVVDKIKNMYNIKCMNTWFNPLDIIICIILSYGLIMGMVHGFIRELTSLAGIVGGFYAAYTYYPMVGTYLKKSFLNPIYLDLISFMMIFLGVMVTGSLIGKLLFHLLKLSDLTLMDRFTGSIFGSAKGILITAFLLAGLTAFLSKDHPLIRNSYLAPKITLLTEKMVVSTPPELRKLYHQKVNVLKKLWRETNAKSTQPPRGF